MGVDEEKGLNFSKPSMDFDAHFPCVFTEDMSKVQSPLLLKCHTDLMFRIDKALGASNLSQIWRNLGAQKLKTINVP